MKKKRIAQSGPIFISLIQSVRAMKTNPGPDLRFSNEIPETVSLVI